MDRQTVSRIGLNAATVGRPSTSCAPFCGRPIQPGRAPDRGVQTDMRTRPARIVIGLVLLGGVAFAPVSAHAPIEPLAQTFRSGVDLVTIQVSVRDTRGRTLSGLSTADFEVRDNGQLRPILSLTDRQGPVSLAILA